MELCVKRPLGHDARVSSCLPSSPNAPSPDLARPGPVLLRAEDLLDKFGFADGDMLAPWVEAWAVSSWPDNWVSGDVDRKEHRVWSYLDDRRLLAHAVTRYVLPRLPTELASAVTAVRGVHNPVRLWALAEEGSYWDETTMLDVLESVEVRLTGADVVALCEELFPERSAEWTDLHDALTWQFSLMESLVSAPTQLWREPAIGLADSLMQRLGADGCCLLADLLRTRGSALSGVSVEELESMACAVEMCLQGE